MKFVRALIVLFCFQLTLIEMGLSQTLRVACIQMEVTHDLDVNLHRILKGIEDASASQVRLALFPETALSGFSRETITVLNMNQLNDAMKTIAAKDNNHLADRRPDLYEILTAPK